MKSDDIDRHTLDAGMYSIDVVFLGNTQTSAPTALKYSNKKAHFSRRVGRGRKKGVQGEWFGDNSGFVS